MHRLKAQPECGPGRGGSSGTRIEAHNRLRLCDGSAAAEQAPSAQMMILRVGADLGCSVVKNLLNFAIPITRACGLGSTNGLLRYSKHTSLAVTQKAVCESEVARSSSWVRKMRLLKYKNVMFCPTQACTNPRFDLK